MIAGYVLLLALMLPGQPMRTQAIPVASLQECTDGKAKFEAAIPGTYDDDGHMGVERKPLTAIARTAICVAIPAAGPVA